MTYGDDDDDSDDGDDGSCNTHARTHTKATPPAPSRRQRRRGSRYLCRRSRARTRSLSSSPSANKRMCTSLSRESPCVCVQTSNTYAHKDEQHGQEGWVEAIKVRCTLYDTYVRVGLGWGEVERREYDIIPRITNGTWVLDLFNMRTHKGCTQQKHKNLFTSTA